MPPQSVLRAECDEDACCEKDYQAAECDVVVPAQSSAPGPAVKCSTEDTQSDDNWVTIPRQPLCFYEQNPSDLPAVTANMAQHALSATMP